MTRPTWDETFINMCDVVAQRSTCAKIKTAAILVRDRNILSIGYNGVPAGAKHCDEHWDFPSPLKVADREFRAAHREWSARFEIHAEINAIVKGQGSARGATLYTLYSPCINCAKCIVSAGIIRVVYSVEYSRDWASTAALFRSVGVEFARLTSST